MEWTTSNLRLSVMIASSCLDVDRVRNQLANKNKYNMKVPSVAIIVIIIIVCSWHCKFPKDPSHQSHVFPVPPVPSGARPSRPPFTPGAAKEPRQPAGGSRIKVTEGRTTSCQHVPFISAAPPTLPNPARKRGSGRGQAGGRTRGRSLVKLLRRLAADGSTLIVAGTLVGHSGKQ